MRDGRPVESLAWTALGTRPTPGGRSVACAVIAGVAAAVLLLAAPAAAVFHPYPASTGADGPCFFPQTGTLNTDTGVYQYGSGSQTFSGTATEPDNGALLRVLDCTTLTVPQGVKLTVSGSRLLDLRASGAVEIDGALDVTGAGGGEGGLGARDVLNIGFGSPGEPGTGAAPSSAGRGGVPYGGETGGTCPDGPGAGGGGASGGDGAYCGTDFHGGSGGGGGGATGGFDVAGSGGDGGKGSGSVRISSPSTITLSSTSSITATGAKGGDRGAGPDSGDGGDGSGGAVFLIAPAVDFQGDVEVRDLDDNGSGGYFRISTFSLTGSTSIYNPPDVVPYAPLLTTDVTGDGSGTIASDPAGIACPGDCSEAYDPGTVVTLQADPGPTSLFAGWSGACSNASGDCVVTMDEARDVTASFASVTLSVGTGGAGGGTVTGDTGGIACPATCEAAYAPGTVVTPSAEPDSSSTFVGWSGACSNVSGDCLVTMDQAEQVTATFAVSPLLSVTSNGSGKGTITSDPSGIRCPGACSDRFEPGAQVTLIAAPASGSVLTGWTGACAGSSAECTVTMTQARSAAATFQPGSRPDGLISAPRASAFLGEGIFNLTGAGQTAGTKVRPGKSAKFTVQLQNDGFAADTLRVSGVGESRSFRVRYLANRQDVTRAVTSGSYSTPPLGAGESSRLTVKVTATKRARAGARASVLVTLTSAGEPALQDAVRAKFRARGRG